MKITFANHSIKTSLNIIGLFLLFGLFYFKLITADFVSWDDTDYILENKDVHNFNIKALISKFYLGNYHPITMLNYAIDWKFFGPNPMGYHIENVLWHFLNTVLVFYFIKDLLKDKGIAVLICLLFAFHPIQIESIAWVAERKNLLATFFILLSSLFYLQFINVKKYQFFILSLLLFSFSLFSKPSFIIFPFIIILIDWYLGQKLTLKNYVLKTPFVICSIIFAFITFKAQLTGGFINTNHAFPIYERIGYAGYGILQYLVHFFNAFHLSAIYPYPQNKTLSLILGYFILICFAIISYKLFKSKKTTLIFGILFFALNLILVLQFIPFGEVLTADRYMYFSIIGLGIILFSSVTFFTNYLVLSASILIISLGSLSFLRLSVWQNSLALYKGILVNYPRSYVALNSIGAEYMLKREYRLAEKYYNQAIYENSKFHKTYYNRALLYSLTNKPEMAIKDYTKAIDIADYYKAYVGRANEYYLIKNYQKAMADAESALLINSNNAKANFVLGNCYDDLNELNKALFHYNKAINSNTSDPSVYLRRGILHGKKQQFELCLIDLETCTNLNKNYAEAYYWKAVVKINSDKNPCSDFKKAIDLGYTAAENSYKKYCK